MPTPAFVAMFLMCSGVNFLGLSTEMNCVKHVCQLSLLISSHFSETLHSAVVVRVCNITPGLPFCSGLWYMVFVLWFSACFSFIKKLDF